METGTDAVRRKSALIADIARRMGEKRFSFGKTALEKLVFLMQEIYNVPCGYKFELYTYGPFSSELLSDLDYVELLDGVQVTYHGPMGYQINPSNENDYVRSLDTNFLAEYGEKIGYAIDEFGIKFAKDLELISTIVYCDRTVDESDKSKFVQVVKSIKPKFPVQEVNLVVRDLELKRFIKTRLDN